MSEAEDLLAFQLKAIGVPFEREVQFAKPRKWRGDFVLRPGEHQPYPDNADWCLWCAGPWPCESAVPPLLIEIDGGTWTQGRHTTGAGFERDCEKLNAATLAGYRVLRFTPAMVDSGVALAMIEKALA